MSNLELVKRIDAENPIEGDLQLTDGQLTLVTGDDAIDQHLRNRLRFFLGEWFLDTRQGLPYFQSVFVKNPNRPAVRSAFRRTIRETPGIVAVTKLQINIAADRSASIDFVATLDRSGEPLVFRDFILPPGGS